MLATESFDVVVSINGIIVFPSVQRGLEEAYRLAKVGGRIVLTAFNQPLQFNVFRYGLAAVHRHLNPSWIPIFPSWLTSLGGAECMEGAMRALGLKDVRSVVVRSAFRIALDDEVSVRWLYSLMRQWLTPHFGVDSVNSIISDIVRETIEKDNGAEADGILSCGTK